jgi:deoxyribose-phosphate aldolase
VVGFPFGYESTRAKVCDTKQAIIEGASEIDMVLPVGLLRDGDVLSVFDDVRGVVDAALEQGRSSGISVLVKVILESSELSPIQLVTGGTIACFAGAHFLKTSTGFASGGATLEALHVMRLIAGEHRGVKASGGIRTREFALQCLSLGVDRIGASSTGTLISTDPPTAQSNDGY